MISPIQPSSGNCCIIDDSAIDNALELVKWIHTEYPDTPIFVVTNAQTWRRAKEFLRAGATDYIPKTFDRDKLALTLKEAIR